MGKNLPDVYPVSKQQDRLWTWGEGESEVEACLRLLERGGGEGEGGWVGAGGGVYGGRLNPTKTD